MNNCFVCHLLHSCVFSLLFRTQSAFFVLFVIWKRRRFVVGTFLVVYESFPMVWICLCLLPWTARRNNEAARWEKVGKAKWPTNADRSALFFFHTVFLGTNAHLFWKLILPSSVFSIVIQLRTFIKVNFFIFLLVRCWYITFIINI